MKTIIAEIMRKFDIEYYASVPFGECKIINEQKLERCFNKTIPETAVVMLAPYYSGAHDGRNISLYAVPRDYHLFFRDLFGFAEAELQKAYPGNIFKGYADSSPIGEADAALKAGLGVLGNNRLLINEKYGSYVFIGEIITDMKFTGEETTANKIKPCLRCGKCAASCPSKKNCLSAVTQKKGALTREEENLIKNNGTAWGCDICQTVCPLNTSAAETPIEFFRRDLTDRAEIGDNITDRAYAWRGRKCIERNLKLLQ